MRLLITALVLLAACEAPDHPPAAGALHAHLRAAVQRGAGTLIALDTIAPGGWSRVYVFGPYTPAPLIEACLRPASVKRLMRGIEMRDDINLLVFQYGEATYHSVAVPRRGADFSPEAVAAGYSPAEARFLTRDPPPHSWGELVPATDPTVRCRAVESVAAHEPPA